MFYPSDEQIAELIAEYEADLQAETINELAIAAA